MISKRSFPRVVKNCWIVAPLPTGRSLLGSQLAVCSGIGGPLCRLMGIAPTICDAFSELTQPQRVDAGSRALLDLNQEMTCSLDLGVRLGRKRPARLQP